jgi:drug/metabolite transporter (DMT)-like permease
MKNKKSWLTYSIFVVLFFGVWGAFINTPEKNGFPATLGYVVWSFTMIPAALFALSRIKWKLATDKKSIIYGVLAGLLGSSGQLLLFITLKQAPAYLVFPLISLMPVITVFLAVIILKEKTGIFGWIGVFLSIIAGVLLAYQPPGNDSGKGFLWLILSFIILILWGVQSFVLRIANEKAKAENIFFYMTCSSLSLIPVAIYLTDFSQPVFWGLEGPYLAGAIQILNSFGALFLVYAFRYGKAIIVAPMTTALPPVLTVLISLSIFNVIPHPVILVGIIIAIVSAFLMGIEEAKEGDSGK